MNFQAEVGSWFAVHLATQTPVGSRFGLATAAYPSTLQFETAAYLDDIVVGLSDLSTILIQCKTGATLGNDADGPLASTIVQLVRYYIDGRALGTKPDPARVSASLVVSAGASSRLDHLEKACRLFDFGASWVEGYSRASDEQKNALNIFKMHVDKAWPTSAATSVADADRVELARLFHIVRFDTGGGGRDTRESAQILNDKLVGDRSGTEALAIVINSTNRLIQTGTLADRQGLLRRLRADGLEDRLAPGFDSDIDQLKKATANELDRLSRHARLPSAGVSVPIPRDCAMALGSAINGGSLLVIGEPGAGKTGVLVNYAITLGSNAPLVFLSVDRLAGVSTSEDLRRELNLAHPLLEVLANWPGTEPGVLIIDALDASRGGPAERIFAALIEDGIAQLGERWSIVASIRTFDLKNGVRFRSIVRGVPPSPDYQERDLGNVRHFLIPRLSRQEIGTLGSTFPALDTLVRTAPPPVQGLLANVFNLSLAAELLESGVSPSSIAKLTTQAELIERYEDERIPSFRLQRAVAAALKVMVPERSLSVRKIRIDNDALDDVLQSGVMAPAGDRVSFAHHVLFDHAASRFYLDRDEPDALVSQVASDPEIGFMLGPAMRFAVERLWDRDDVARRKSWRLIAGMCARTDIDPIITSVALRTAAERVEGPDDITGLTELLQTHDPKQLGLVLHRAARFVGMRAAEGSGLSGAATTAWAKAALAAVGAEKVEFVEGARFLLWTLSEKADFTDPIFSMVFGEAARALLAFAWANEPRMSGLSPQAIRFVTKSFATNVPASRKLLEAILVEPRFSAHAAEEAPRLAEGLATIALADPEFAYRIYEAIFSKSVEDGHSWLGGQPSRIMALSSNRKQDYEHGRWQLKRNFPKFVAASSDWGTRAASAAAIGTAIDSGTRRRSGNQTVEAQLPNGRTLEIYEDRQTLQDWREPPHWEREDVLTSFADYLRTCSHDQFERVVATATAHLSAASVWSRILGIASERTDIPSDWLWPIATTFDLLGLLDITRDAVFYIAAVYANRPLEERAEFETHLIDWIATGGEFRRGRSAVAARLLSTVDETLLATPAMRDLKADLKDEGALFGNRPYMTVSSHVSDRDIVDSMFEDEGADLEKGPDKVLRDAQRRVDDQLKAWPEKAEPAHVATLWAAVIDAIAALDDENNADAVEVARRSTWGVVGSATEKITDSEAYAPEKDGHPSLDRLIEFVDRLSRSPFPEERDSDDDRGLAWGNWDVRVYAASAAIDLARRFADRAPTALALVDRLIGDTVPAVRLQVVQSLNTLWDIANSKMWELFERVARTEVHPSVLGFFVGGPLRRVSEPEPERVEALVDEFLPRLMRDSDEHAKERREPAAEALASLAARMWLGRGRLPAKVWIDGWLADLDRGESYLWQFTSALRGALFERYLAPESTEASAIQQRAHDFIAQLVAEAARWMAESAPIYLMPETGQEAKEAAQNRYRVGEHLLDHAANQLYFGSGVFQGAQPSDEDERGLQTIDAKRDFLESYASVLIDIGEQGTPRTIYHLVELYEFLAEAAPDTVFDRVAAILVGAGKREGYQYESLGSEALVRLIRRYLADFRPVFEDKSRRTRLVEVLELFSSAGWPDALKLLYDLPDLLR